MKNFFRFIFLSQFGGLIRIGSSSIGGHLLLLPILFLNKKTLKNYSLFLPILVISFFFGFNNYRELNLLEIGQRFISISIIFYLMTFFKDFINSSTLEERQIFFQRLLILSIPSILINLLEIIYRLTSQFLPLLIFIKRIFIPFRSGGIYTAGTIAGFFPEHGLFPPYLLMMLGTSLIYLILFSGRNKKIIYNLIAIIWILLSIVHLSGLYYFSIGITLGLILIMQLLYLFFYFKINRNITKLFSLLFISLTSIMFFIRTYDERFFNRLGNFIIYIPSFFNFNFSNVFDTSLLYKFLPYTLAKSISFNTFFFGTGISFYSSYVTENLDNIPNAIKSISYFQQNLAVQRFPLNSYIVCLIIEIGIIGILTLIILLPKPISIELSNFLPYPGYKDIKNSTLSRKEKFFTILAIFALFTSFNTIFGAVPLLYPYPWISLGSIMIIIDTQKILKNKNLK